MGDLVKSAEQDTTLAALRKREQSVAKRLATLRLELHLVEAQHAELTAVIDLVQRGGREKPGPKSGTPSVRSARSPAEEPATETAGEAV